MEGEKNCNMSGDDEWDSDKEYDEGTEFSEVFVLSLQRVARRYRHLLQDPLTI